MSLLGSKLPGFQAIVFVLAECVQVKSLQLCPTLRPRGL